MNRSPWIALLASAMIGFSNVNLNAQRGPDDQPPPHNREDDGPRRDGRPAPGDRPGPGDRAGRRPGPPEGAGGPRGGMEEQIRQLREQVRRLSEQLEKLQSSSGRDERGPQERNPSGMRERMGANRGGPMMGRFGFRGRGNAWQGRGRFNRGFGRFGGMHSRHRGMRMHHRMGHRFGRGEFGGGRSFRPHRMHSMRSSEGFRGWGRGGMESRDSMRGGQRFGGMMSRLFGRLFAERGRSFGRDESDRVGQDRSDDRNRPGVERRAAPRDGGQRDEGSSDGRGRDAWRGGWQRQQGGASDGKGSDARDGEGHVAREGHATRPREGARSAGQRHHHGDEDEKSGDAGGDGGSRPKD